MNLLKKKYVVDLSKEEKQWLQELTTKGQSAARRIRRAHILLLLADEGLKDKEIARLLSAAVTTLERVRKRFVEEGLEVALSERPRIGGALRGAGWTVRGRHTWWRWPAASRPRGANVGR